MIVSASDIVASDDYSWFPAIDGFTLRADPLSLAVLGEFHQVDIIIGTNTNEGTMFVNLDITEAGYILKAQSTFGPNAEKVLAMYPSSNYKSPGFADAAVFTDYFFYCPSRRLVRLLTNATAFMYQFAHIPSFVRCPGFLCKFVGDGVFHTSELFFVWSNSLPFPGYNFTAAETLLTHEMSNFWGSFATIGKPVTKYSPVSWTPYSLQHEEYLILNTTALAVHFHYKEKFCEMWDSITPVSGMMP